MASCVSRPGRHRRRTPRQGKYRHHGNPYVVNKSSLVKSIAELVHNKTLDGISDVRDESDKNGIRIVIELKRGIIPKVMLNNLYKHTQLQTTFGAIMLAIDKGRPRVMNLKQMLEAFLAHRVEVITNRTKFELKKAEDRAHILEGLKIAIDNLDAVVKIIRGASNRDEARKELMRRFGLTEIQTNAILDMRLYQLTGLERNKLEDEYLALIQHISRLRELLASRTKILEVIKEDLLEIKELYGDERRTDIVPDEGEMQIEDLIADRSCVITISHSGYIKRVPVSTYRAQRRGGKGVAGMETREDYVEHVFIASTHDYILFYRERTLVLGKSLRNPRSRTRCPRQGDCQPAGTAGRRKSRRWCACAISRRRNSWSWPPARGIVKKTRLSDFSRPRRNGIIAINIDDGDRLIGVKQTSGNDDIMLATRQGMSLRFEETELRVMGRATRGVIGIRLAKDDCLETIEIVHHAQRSSFALSTATANARHLTSIAVNDGRQRHFHHARFRA